MATTDDFTFQITATTLPCLVNSPPMWCPASTSEISTYDREEILNTVQRRSFSYVEGGVSDEYGEDKMDMLWEDLNDEFSKRCGSDLNLGDSPGRFVKFGCVRGRAVVKKPRTVSFLKVFKKLFLLHSFQGNSLKKRTCDPKIRV